MTKLESKTVTIDQSAGDLHAVLSKFDNFGSFMPDSVTKFEADDTSFKFGLKGMPEVRLVLEDSRTPELIKLKSASGKIDFSLSALITALDDTRSELKFEFAGNFNPMLKMMVERPLQSFIEELVDNIAASDLTRP